VTRSKNKLERSFSIYLPAKERLVHSRDRFVSVPILEPGFPIPNRPAETKPLRGAAHVRVKTNTRLAIRFFVGAEFPKVNRTMMLLRPRRYVFHAGHERFWPAWIFGRRQLIVSLKPLRESRIALQQFCIRL